MAFNAAWGPNRCSVRIVAPARKIKYILTGRHGKIDLITQDHEPNDFRSMLYRYVCSIRVGCLRTMLFDLRTLWFRDAIRLRKKGKMCKKERVYIVSVQKSKQNVLFFRALASKEGFAYCASICSLCSHFKACSVTKQQFFCVCSTNQF